ncbi:MAG: transposase, partial [Rickettsiales bacterium]|nr:transposase [Rickettsiales bacterium]
NKEVAESKLLELQDKWQGKYRLAVKSWVENWDLISNYFKYPPDLRKIIYTTNSVESYHRMIRLTHSSIRSIPLGCLTINR